MLIQAAWDLLCSHEDGRRSRRCHEICMIWEAMALRAEIMRCSSMKCARLDSVYIWQVKSRNQYDFVHGITAALSFGKSLRLS